jgi:hypothetical protein
MACERIQIKIVTPKVAIDSIRSSAGVKCSTKMTGICFRPTARAVSTAPWPVDDCSVLADEDRLADTELFDADADPRDLRGFRPADATRRRPHLVDRHIGHRERR